jgi:hypothetical protein
LDDLEGVIVEPARLGISSADPSAGTATFHGRIDRRWPNVYARFGISEFWKTSGFCSRYTVVECIRASRDFLSFAESTKSLFRVGWGIVALGFCTAGARAMTV